jgi:hypothetical protein
MKKYLLGIFAIALSIGFSAFENKKGLKPFYSQRFYYIQFAPSQRIESGYYGNEEDYREDSMNEFNYLEFRTVSNWSTTSNGKTESPTGAYINYITIDNYDAASDGNDSDGISLEEALYQLRYKHFEDGYGDLECDGNPGTSSVYVYCYNTPSVW